MGNIYLEAGKVGFITGLLFGFGFWTAFYGLKAVYSLFYRYFLRKLP